MTSNTENLCQRCGTSCHASVTLPSSGKNIVVKDLHCKYLTTESTCSVYENRLEIAPWCRHTSTAEPQNLLRTDCPYTLLARGSENNKGKQKLPDLEYDAQFPEIVEELLKIRKINLNFSCAGFIKTLKVRDPEYTWSVYTDRINGSSRLIRERTTAWTRFRNFVLHVT